MRPSLSDAFARLAAMVILWLLAPTALPPAPVSAAEDARPKVVGYVPNWIDLKTFSRQIDYAAVTHLNIAFENPVNAAGDLSVNMGNQFLINQARAKNVKILVSIGGGAASDDRELKARYFDLIGPEKRKAFAESLADYLDRHRLDGLDVDLEGPSINEDYGPFIETLAAVLKPRRKLLTAALSQGYGGKNVPDSVFEHFDFVNIMAYDGSGPWNPKDARPHSTVEFAKSNTQYWLGRGLPRSKAVLGVPFYGYGFGKDFRKSSYSYKSLLERFPDAHATDQVGETIWYNGQPSIAAKARYVKDEGLGGVMIWSLDNDAPGEASLLKTISETLAE